MGRRRLLLSRGRAALFSPAPDETTAECKDPQNSGVEGARASSEAVGEYRLCI